MDNGYEFDERAIRKLVRARAAIFKNNQLVSPFLKLLAEMRNCIYDWSCVPSTFKFTSKFHRTDTPSYADRHQSAFALLHTSRQIRYEVIPIFCNYTTFDMSLAFPSEEVDLSTRNAIKSVVLSEDSLTGFWCDGQLNGKQQHKHFGKNWRLLTGFSAYFPALENMYVEVDDPERWLPCVGRLRECIVALYGGKNIHIHLNKPGQREWETWDDSGENSRGVAQLQT